MPIYSCKNCGSQYPKWQGRCTDCGQWGTLVIEENLTAAGLWSNKSAKNAAVKTRVEITSLADLTAMAINRHQSSLKEIDMLFGGGLVPGSLILLAGEPGIGKSTLTLQLVSWLDSQKRALYLAGEESADQIKNRLDRLKIKPDLKFLNQPTLEKALAAINQEKPEILIVDSIQTLGSELIEGPPGSLNQIRACAAQLLEICKKNQIICVLVGQITKDGLIAGPKALEHLVDVVVYLEGDPLHDFRLLKVNKNRFGPAGELLVFKMTETGLEIVSNPSSIFLGDPAETEKEGSVITAILEGSKTFLIEIQALVTPTNFGYPQRRSAGFDNNRLQLLLAVLIKRAKLAMLNSHDVHINVAGGYQIDDPAADLALCLAIASSLYGKSFNQKTLVFGEVGLGGEIRASKRSDSRIKEATKLGFTNFITPASIKNLIEALKILQ